MLLWHVKGRSKHEVSSSVGFHLVFWGWDLSQNLKFMNSSRLGNNELQRSACPLFSITKVIDPCHNTWQFYLVAANSNSGPDAFVAKNFTNSTIPEASR